MRPSWSSMLDTPPPLLPGRHGLDHVYDPTPEVDAVPPERHQLADAQAGAEEEGPGWIGAVALHEVEDLARACAGVQCLDRPLVRGRPR
jgi:hypothetical protein